VLDDGLYPLTAVDKAVLDASREFEPIEISSAVQAPTSALVPSGPEEARPPAEAPSLEDHGQGDLICSVSGKDPRTPQVTVGGEVFGLDRAIPTAGTSTGRTP